MKLKVSILIHFLYFVSLSLWKTFGQIIPTEPLKTDDLFPFAIDNPVPGEEYLQNPLGLVDNDALNNYLDSGLGSLGVGNQFNEEIFPTEAYLAFKGLDETAMFATSISISGNRAAVGSNGYEVFNGAVYIYLHDSSDGTGEVWKLEATIRSPDSHNSNFGLSVALDGNNLLISANVHDGFTGRVYLYTLNEFNVWILTKVFKSPRPRFESFGSCVTLSGTVAAIGTSTGYVFIYELINQVWTATQTLTSSDQQDYFGRALIASGDWLVVGSHGYGNSAGAAYIYQRSSLGKWFHFTSLSSPTGYNAQFGYSLALWNSTLVVGAPGYRAGITDAIGSDWLNSTGAVYSYEFNELTNSWNLTQAIPSPAGYNSYFGTAVRASEHRLAIGAEGYPLGNNTGVAYVYSRTYAGSQWQKNLYFPSPAGEKGHFGAALDCNERVVAIGAFGYDDLRGSIYFASLPYLYLPTAAPTLPPAAINSAPNNNIFGNLTAGALAAIFLAAFFFLAAVAALIYFCCCRGEVIVLDKKKKKEEEDSPYTVHAFNGYSEMGDGPPQPPLPPYAPYDGGLPPGDYSGKDGKSMDKNGKIIDKADPAFVRKMFPYKVYSYRGYKEGDEQTQENQQQTQLPPYSQTQFPPYPQISKPLPTLMEEENEEVDEQGNDESSEMSSEQQTNYVAPLESESLSYMDGRSNRNSLVQSVDLTAIRPELKRYYENADYSNSSAIAYERDGEISKFEKATPNNNKLTSLPPLPPQSHPLTVPESTPPKEKNYVEDAQSKYARFLAAAAVARNNPGSVASPPLPPSPSAAEDVASNNNLVDSAQSKYAKYLAAAKNNKMGSPPLTSPPLRQKTRRTLQSPSMELDVALTEPLKLLSLQEARDKNLRSESLDPEARNDLAQQDEVDRLRSVEAARTQAMIEEANSKLIGHVPSADEETIRNRELNRLKEEARLRHEENIRARFALFKARAESLNAAQGSSASKEQEPEK